MTYQVQFTDSSNPNKPQITVLDGTVNKTSTSLGFVGQQYPGYASTIANNFLHLLENFASPIAPGSDPNNPMGPPVQGQLWYDTSTNILKVYDGTTWTTAGSLKKSSSAPAVANSIAGDLWANTTTSQLYIFSGSAWLLVGPQFSTGTQSGPLAETIIDTDNISHTVVSIYANNIRISIISSDQFIPKSTIAGFDTIYRGTTLSNIGLTKFWGVAQKADALLVNGNTIPASNFLTTDGTTTTTNAPLNIRTDSGLTIGSNSSFIFDIENSVPTIKSTLSGSGINFNLTQSAVTSPVLHINSNGRVGVGFSNTAPVSTLDVKGVLTIKDDVSNSITSYLNVTSTLDTSYTPGTLFTTATGSIVTQGGITIAKKSTFGDDITFYGQEFFNYYDNTGAPIAAPVLLPGYSTSSTEATSLNIPYIPAGVYDIGSSTRSFRNIYATNFSGNFSGTFTGTLEGSISGTAAALASPTVFSLTGDVTSNNLSFNGQTTTGTAVFQTKISPDFISAQSAATDSYANDQLLVYRSGQGLLRMTKATLFNHQALVPIATILPFAGAIVPTGYLLCDGAEVLISQYPGLYSVIGFTYRASGLLRGLGTFALPDLRGRFPLGADSMNNNISVPSKDGSGTQVTTTLDLNGNTSSTANRVNDASAKTIGSGNSTANGTVTLISSNLPDHNHSLNDGTSQFYAVNTPREAPDPYAIGNVGTTGSGTVGSGILNTGSVNGATGIPVNVMNPYATINYIIFTGAL
jgi:microcystin-dependent protein